MEGKEDRDGCYVEAITEWPVTQSPDQVEKSDREKMTLAESEKKRKMDRCYSLNIKTKCLKKDASDIHHINPGDQDFVSTKHEMLANTAVARWWRRHGQSLIDRSQLPATTNANTLISYIIRSEPAKCFLRNEIKRLLELVAAGRYTANTMAALGSFYEKMEEFQEAEKYLIWSVSLDNKNSENKWLLKRIQKQLQVEHIQDELQQKLNLSSRGNSIRVFPATKQVLKVPAESLSYKDFFYNYAATSTPLIITDVVKKMTPVQWTFEYIKQMAGDCVAVLKTMVDESVEWAKLEDHKSMSVKDFIESMEDRERKSYLFDWSLPIHCPKLVEEMVIPKYFAGDFLQRTEPGSLYRDSWPSLFIAPAGLKSELHVDAFGSNFWMALFQGQKRWTFFGKEDFACLYPKYAHSMDPVFNVDLTNVDLEHHPLLAETRPIQCVLQPGELLFVPAGCPHRVENLETSIAISSNFVDLSNISLVEEELSVNGYIDPRAEDLYNQLLSPAFNRKMSSDIKDKTWQEFKTWPPNCDSQIFDISSSDIT